MIKKFSTYLTQIKYSSRQQKIKEIWHIEGVLKNRLNQKFKFDLRPIKDNGKVGSFRTKADKMVFDMKDQWVIIDVEELHQYIKENDLKDVHLQSLISKLDWNIILPK